MKTILINISIVIFIFFSCEAQNTNITAMPMSATACENENQYVLSNNQFAFKIFNAMKSEDSNLFITTFGLYNSLFPLYFGAASKTKEEIASLLNLSQLDTTFISDYSKIDSILNKNQDKYLFKYANSIWCDSTVKIKSNYKTNVINKTNIDLTQINLSNSIDACNVINNWVSKNTNGQIKSVIDENNLNPNTRSLLLNTLFLDAEWAFKFDESLTSEKSFYNYNGKSVLTPFINQTNSFNYFENNHLKIVELKYIGNDFSLFIILPLEFETAQNIFTQSLIDILQNPENFLTSHNVNVSLPKFRVDNKLSFVKPLEELGVKSLFNINCDLSNLFVQNNNLVSDIFQKNIFEINETKTVFVSATITQLINISNNSSKENIKYFNANHPFYYLLMNNETGLIITIGQTLKLN